MYQNKLLNWHNKFYTAKVRILLAYTISKENPKEIQLL